VSWPHDKHLLSMKDNDQSANLRALIDAGISSFKIEGRLKDAGLREEHHRALPARIARRILEDGFPAYSRSIVGAAAPSLFTPQPEKTFNRGATDYFVNGASTTSAPSTRPSLRRREDRRDRHPHRTHRHGSTYDSEDQTLHNGDGISPIYQREAGSSSALRINLAEALGDAYRLFAGAD
jgi:hypothetical protein